MDLDGELFLAWRAGDLRAGETLFQRNFAVVHRFFVNKTDRDTEDLVQRTFMACIEGQHRFEGRASFRAYLLGIANHMVCEFYRKRGRNREVDFERDAIADLGAGPSTLMAERREQRTLLEALCHIPVKYQVVLELHYWEKLTGPEIGTALEIPENTAYARIRLAKEQLRRALKRLDASRELLDSTDADLEGWADSVRPSKNVP